MSSSASPGSHYGMPQPENWPALIGFADELIADSNLNPNARIADLWRKSDKLDNNALERCRYYGLGLAICELAQVLCDPQILDQTIQDRSDHITRRHTDYCDLYFYKPEEGLHIGELAYNGYALTHTEPAAKMAISRLPANALLTTDVLFYVKHQRVNNRRFGDLPTDINIDEQVAKLAHRDATLDSASQLLSAASSLTVIALQNLHNKEAAPSPDDRANSDPLISDVVTDEEFRGLDLLQVAGFSASLRLDEFIEHLGLTVDAEGRTAFDLASVPSDPGPINEGTPMNPTELIHTDRLRCPALYVNGILRLALGIVPEAAILANAKISLSRNWRPLANSHKAKQE